MLVDVSGGSPTPCTMVILGERVSVSLTVRDRDGSGTETAGGCASLRPSLLECNGLSLVLTAGPIEKGELTRGGGVLLGRIRRRGNEDPRKSLTLGTGT